MLNIKQLYNTQKQLLLSTNEITIDTMQYRAMLYIDEQTNKQGDEKMTKTKTVQDVASEMLDNMEQKTRTNGDKFYCCKKEIEWQTDIIHSAHGDKLPDDYVYQFVNDTLCVLADCKEGNEEDAISEMEADCYTSNLTSWLNSRCDRVYYLTEALEETETKDGFQALSYAQYKEIQEVAQAVLNGIREYIENLN